MDKQVVDMIRDRFDKVDIALEEVRTTFDKHSEKDEVYWRRVDQRDAQLSVFKWITGGMSGSALLAWIYEKLGH